MVLPQKTVFRRCRSGVKVQRWRRPGSHLRHDRAKPIPAIFRLPTELRLAIWELVVAPELPDRPLEKNKKKLSPNMNNPDIMDSGPGTVDLIAHMPGGMGFEPYPRPSSESYDPLPSPHDRLKPLEFACVKPLPILMVCKQMTREALPIIFDCRRWRFDVPAHFDIARHLPYFKPGRGITHEQRQNPILSEDESGKSQAFITDKLEQLRKSISESDLSCGATVFPFPVRTYRRKEHAYNYHTDPLGQIHRRLGDNSDFPLADRLPWATWSWIRTFEDLVELKHLHFAVHLDRHLSNAGSYAWPQNLRVDISTLASPSKQGQSQSPTSSSKGAPSSSGRRVQISWNDIAPFEHFRPYMQEIQCILDETVRMISSRRHFRGFTLLDVEILASVFQFEAWECEEATCWPCGRWPRHVPAPVDSFLDPFAFLAFPQPPPPAPAPAPVLGDDAGEADGDNVVVIGEDGIPLRDADEGSAVHQTQAATQSHEEQVSLASSSLEDAYDAVAMRNSFHSSENETQFRDDNEPSTVDQRPTSSRGDQGYDHVMAEMEAEKARNMARVRERHRRETEHNAAQEESSKSAAGHLKNGNDNDSVGSSTVRAPFRDPIREANGPASLSDDLVEFKRQLYLLEQQNMRRREERDRQLRESQQHR